MTRAPVASPALSAWREGNWAHIVTIGRGFPFAGSCEWCAVDPSCERIYVIDEDNPQVNFAHCAVLE